jgi:N-acetylneuraminic acid mutarotase
MKNMLSKGGQSSRRLGLVFVFLAGIVSLLGSGGGGGTSESDTSPNEGWVTITYPTTADTYSTDTSPQYISGEAFISPTWWRCCSGDASDTGVTVNWTNAATGQSDQASQHVGICWFLWSPYLCNHSWSANIPVVEGNNLITVTASDPSGNIGNDRITIIRTADATPPAVVSTTPSDGETNVSLYDPLVVRFSESVNPASVTAGSFTLLGFGGAQVDGDLSVSQTGLEVNFAPASPLESNQAFTATLTTAITDLSGNPLAADYSWTFQTGVGDTVPPTVASTIPAPGAVNVSPDSSIMVTFSEPIYEPSITTNSFLLYDAGNNRVDGTVSSSGETATFAPSVTLDENAQYHAVITTVVTDLRGNHLASEYTWSFTTGILDVTPPAVVSTSPAAGVTGAPIEGSIIVTFSEAMDETTINFASFLLEDSAGNLIGGTISGSSFKPYASLALNETYTATLTTAVTDVAGNPLAQAYVWSFTTTPDGIGTWTPTSTINAPAPRVAATAVWTGSEMIVWGGYNGSYLNSGGRYNPATDTWQSVSQVNAPSGRTAHVAVWTGTEMIVWGGYPSTTTGGRYNPVTDTWAPLTAGTYWHSSVVWTGSEMIVWGGEPYTNAGTVYNPGLDTRQSTTPIGAPGARSEHSAVWTGSRMIIWGGEVSDNALNTGGSYDPATDSWSSVSTTSAPYSYQHAAQWTGSEMLVWGGTTGADNDNAGYRYDPVINSWDAFPTLDALVPREWPLSAWTGQHLIVWGGLSGSSVINSGGIYDPVSDSWSLMSYAGVPTGRYLGVAVWTGSEFLVWGGQDDSGANTNSGGRFRYP